MLNKLKAKIRGSRGFTLVELMVVLVILGIVAAVGLPAFTGYIDKGRENAVITEAHAAVAAAQSLCSAKYQAGGFDDPGKVLREWYQGSSDKMPSPTFPEQSEEYQVRAESPTQFWNFPTTALDDINDLANQEGDVTDFVVDDDGLLVWLTYKNGEIYVTYYAESNNIGNPTPVPTDPHGPLPEIQPDDGTGGGTGGSTYQPETKVFTLLDNNDVVTVTVEVQAESWPTAEDLVGLKDGFTPVAGTFYYSQAKPGTLYFCISSPGNFTESYCPKISDSIVEWNVRPVGTANSTDTVSTHIYTVQNYEQFYNGITIGSNQFYITDAKELYFTASGGSIGLPTGGDSSWRSVSYISAEIVYKTTTSDNTVYLWAVDENGNKLAGVPLYIPSCASGISSPYTGVAVELKDKDTTGENEITARINEKDGFGDNTNYDTTKSITKFTFKDGTASLAKNSSGYVSGNNIYIVCKLRQKDLKKINIYKYDREGEPLPDATIAITDENGQVLEALHSEDNNSSLTNSSKQKLTYGVTYTISETVTPPGYLQAGDIKFSIEYRNDDDWLCIDGEEPIKIEEKPNIIIYNETESTDITFNYTNCNQNFPNSEVAFVAANESFPDVTASQYQPDTYAYTAPADLDALFGKNGAIQVKTGDTTLTYGGDSENSFTVSGYYNPNAAGVYRLVITKNSGGAAALIIRVYNYESLQLNRTGGTVTLKYILPLEFYKIRAQDNTPANAEQDGSANKSPDKAHLNNGNIINDNGTYYVASNNIQLFTIANGSSPSTLSYRSFSVMNTISGAVVERNEAFVSGNTWAQGFSKGTLGYFITNDVAELYISRAEVSKSNDPANAENQSISSSDSNKLWQTLPTWAWEAAASGNLLIKPVLKDDDSGAILSGIRYTLNRADGTTVKSWTSGLVAQSLQVEPGTYYLEQAYCPPKYTPADETTFPIKIDIVADGAAEPLIVTLQYIDTDISFYYTNGEQEFPNDAVAFVAAGEELPGNDAAYAPDSHTYQAPVDLAALLGESGALQVKSNGKPLAMDTDYTVTGEYDAATAGKYTLTITLKSNKHSKPLTVYVYKYESLTYPCASGGNITLNYILPANFYKVRADDNAPTSTDDDSGIHAIVNNGNIIRDGSNYYIVTNNISLYHLLDCNSDSKLSEGLNKMFSSYRSFGKVTVIDGKIISKNAPYVNTSGNWVNSMNKGTLGYWADDDGKDQLYSLRYNLTTSNSAGEIYRTESGNQYLIWHPVSAWAWEYTA